MKRKKSVVDITYSAETWYKVSRIRWDLFVRVYSLLRIKTSSFLIITNKVACITYEQLVKACARACVRITKRGSFHSHPKHISSINLCTHVIAATTTTTNSTIIDCIQPYAAHMSFSYNLVIHLFPFVSPFPFSFSLSLQLSLTHPIIRFVCKNNSAITIGIIRSGGISQIHVLISANKSQWKTDVISFSCTSILSVFLFCMHRSVPNM